MIEERFLQSAVNIRRTYLKVSNNLNFYHRRAKELVDTLNGALERIDKLQSQINLKNGTVTSEQAVSELMSIIQDIEDEGKKLESLSEPMNKEIEKLAVEEQELYQQIKKYHTTLSDDDIINSIRSRLDYEGLS